MPVDAPACGCACLWMRVHVCRGGIVRTKAGAEIIHFGQIMLMSKYDTGNENIWKVLSLVRQFADRSARRNFVLCNAHLFESKWKYKDTLLMDFHAFPSRPDDQEIMPQKVTRLRNARPAFTAP